MPVPVATSSTRSPEPARTASTMARRHRGSWPKLSAAPTRSYRRGRPSNSAKAWRLRSLSPLTETSSIVAVSIAVASGGCKGGRGTQGPSRRICRSRRLPFRCSPAVARRRPTPARRHEQEHDEQQRQDQRGAAPEEEGPHPPPEKAGGEGAR